MLSAVVSWRIDAPPPLLVLFSYPVVCVWLRLYAWGPGEPPLVILSTRIFLQLLLLMLLLPVE